MDAGTLQESQPDEIGQDASNLVSALGSQSWIAAAVAGVILVLALLKKFGVLGAKKATPPAEVKADPSADQAADQARASLSMKDPK